MLRIKSLFGFAPDRFVVGNVTVNHGMKFLGNFGNGVTGKGDSVLDADNHANKGFVLRTILNDGLVAFVGDGAVAHGFIINTPLSGVNQGAV